MAVVLPIIQAFSAVSAAGGLAAAMSTVTGFLSVAGGVLAGVGAITGEKDIARLGGLMSLGSALGGAFGGASAAGGAAETAGAAAGEGLKVSQSAMDVTQAATNASAAPTIGTIGDFGEAAQAAAGNGLVAPGAEGAWWQQAPVGQAGERSLLSRVASGDIGGLNDPGLATRIGMGSPIADPVAQAGRSMSSSQLQSLLGTTADKAARLAGQAGAVGTEAPGLLARAGGFIKNNKELVSLGGGILQSMYGPQAEQVDMQKSILARRQRNMNSQIRLGPIVPGRV